MEEEEEESGGGAAEERWDVLLEPRTREEEEDEVGEVGQEEEERRAARSDLKPRRRSAGGPELRRHASRLLKREEQEKEGEGEIVRGFPLSGRVVSEQGKEEQEEVDTSPGFSSPPLLFLFFSSDLRRIPARSAAAQESDPVRSVSPLRSSARSARRNIHDATVRSTCTPA